LILHILQDEKFSEMAIELFESVSKNKNDYCVITNKSNFKFIKTSKVKKISNFKLLNGSFLGTFNNYDFVVLHLLDQKNKYIIMNASKDVKFLWIGWGMDYYDFISQDLHLDQTKLLLVSQKQYSIKTFVKTFLFRNYNVNDVMKRVDFFAPVLENEYELVKQHFDEFKPKFIDWNYGTLEQIVSGFKDIKLNGNNVLVGNSATPTNNHYEAFDLLKQINFNNKVFVPLSYGVEEYKNSIIKLGNDLFQQNFYPLTDFMVLEEYLKLISSCSVVVMNHLRQQAIGNINIMLYLGARVFLNKKNPAYDFYKELGVTFNTVDELSMELIHQPLTYIEVENNRDALKKVWSEENMHLKTKKLIEEITRYEK